MAAPQLRLTIADHVEAIGMRVLRIAEDMARPSHHHGRNDSGSRTWSRWRRISESQCGCVDKLAV